MTKHEKHALTAWPVHPLISERWSPYCLAPTPVKREDLLAILEAARWAPSSYNEQPWRYLLARREDGEAFQAMLSCLVEPNQAWAKHAGVLLIGVAKLNFARNGKPNKAAHHDLGLAAGNICTEATARGLCVHQMIGILPDRVRELYAVAADAEPLTALAIGYLGSGADFPEALRERDQGPRSRLAIESFVFEGSWEKPATLRG